MDQFKEIPPLESLQKGACNILPHTFKMWPLYLTQCYSW